MKFSKKTMISVIAVTSIIVFSLLLIFLITQKSFFFHPKTPREKLLAHSKEFNPPRIHKVTDGVYVAVGYGLANAIMIEGKDGVIIVDTLENMENAKVVKEKFDKISGNKPVKAIIYTHYHPDHTFGAKAFAGKDNPQVIAYYLMPKEMENMMTGVQPIVFIRSMRMYGNLLPPEAKVNDGIGPALKINKNFSIGFLPPTYTFKENSVKLNIAGVDLELMHSPGETNDQLAVWLPQRKVLLPGDNFYQSFPNLYTIRGSSSRNSSAWIQSLDVMRTKNAEYLVPSHTNFIKGGSKVAEALTNYRDAIQYVRDQTIRKMNLGLTANEIAASIKLPKVLANDPNLQPYYGTVFWSSRGIFEHYLGWFSGRARDLFPFTPQENAQHLADLVGGTSKMLSQAQKSYDKKDYQWALQLSDDVLILQPENEAAKKIKINALNQMADISGNANARNYLMTEALETSGQINLRTQLHYFKSETYAALPLDRIFKTLGTRLIPEKAPEDILTINFIFTDTRQVFATVVRHDIVEISTQLLPKPILTVKTDSLTFKNLLSGRSSVQDALAQGHLVVEGNVNQLSQFLTFFDQF